MYADCEACPVAAAIDGLDAANRQAWRLYRQIATRFAVDAQAVGFVFQRVTHGLDDDAFAELLERFVVLHDVLCPPPKQED